jgi:hypothetical protein
MPVELEKEDKVISEFLKSIGPWRNHLVIGGGYALIIYKLYLADRKIGNPPVGTRDLDTLIPRKIPEVSTKNIAKYLKDAGFNQVFKDYENPATEAYFKEINGFDVEIEFLTDTATRGDKNKNVVIAGVVAQPLSYLKLSLQKTLEFKTFSNEPGMVVSPEAWLFHKGLTFPRRTNESKLYKDLYGIWYVSTQLGNFSNRAIAELMVLAQQHPKWFKAFQGNFLKLMENIAPIDWIKLEAQDPFGRLKKPSFERLVKVLIEKKA